MNSTIVKCHRVKYIENGDDGCFPYESAKNRREHLYVYKQI
jgi:hypothetical protein